MQMAISAYKEAKVKSKLKAAQIFSIPGNHPSQPAC